jgi:hypothetical protein
MTPVRATRAIKPRRLVHRGAVEASGFFFDTNLIELREARKRILDLWEPGAQVYRLEGGLLLRLVTPTRVNSALARGLPLVREGQALLSAPLDEKEFPAASGGEAVVLILQGRLETIPLANTEREDPAKWLDMPGWKVEEVANLSAPPCGAEAVLETPPFDTREKLGGVPPPSKEASELLASLLRARTQKKGKNPGSALNSPGGKAAAQVLGGVFGFLGSILGRIGGIGTGGAAGGGRWSERESGSSFVPQKTRTGLTSSILQRLSVGLAVTFGLAGFFGRRQARYISRMMEMFREGEMDQALRHAIPLGGPGGLEAAIAALGLPIPRLNLNISAQSSPASSSIGGGPDLFEELRRLYRRAFERLEEEGRIDEAAFVLAELLHSNDEAVAFLEKHGRLKLAAEMAEARGLPSGVVVRQWFLAGDVERAVLIARRYGAFASAVLRLAESDPLAAEMRLVWAETLAAAGDYAGAVQVASPLPNSREIVTKWIDLSISTGGVVGARSLALKLEVYPEAFEELSGPCMDLLNDDSEERAAARTAFAETLIKGSKSEAATCLARVAVRSQLRDAARGLPILSSGDYRKLVHFMTNSALAADLPALPAARRTGLVDREEPFHLHIDSADTGTMPIYDAAMLPDGKCVAALGEVGLRLLTRDGRTVVHWDQPAHRIVLSDRGDRAILLAPRGEVQRLARIDFVTRRVEHWCEAAIGAFAPNYDGSLWFAAVGEDFGAVDTLAPGLRLLWRRPGIGEAIECVARSETRCSISTSMVETTDSWGNPTTPRTKREVWKFTLPGPVLQSQMEHALSRHDGMWPFHTNLAVNANSGVAELSVLMPDDVPEQALILNACKWKLSVDAWGENSISHGPVWTLIEEMPIFHDNWVAAAITEENGISLLIVHTRNTKILANVILDGAKRVSARITLPYITFCDDRGRLLVLDVTSGSLVRNLRV